MTDPEEVHRTLGRIEGKLDGQDQRFDAIDRRLDSMSKAKSELRDEFEMHAKATDAHGAGAVRANHGVIAGWGGLLIAAVTLLYMMMGKEDAHGRQGPAKEVAGGAARQAVQARR